MKICSKRIFLRQRYRRDLTKTYNANPMVKVVEKKKKKHWLIRVKSSLRYHDKINGDGCRKISRLFLQLVDDTCFMKLRVF